MKVATLVSSEINPDLLALAEQLLAEVKDGTVIAAAVVTLEKNQVIGTFTAHPDSVRPSALAGAIAQLQWEIHAKVAGK